MRVKIIFKLMVLFTLVAIGQEVRAQLPSGRIVGRVTDASTGDFLPGANVILVGTNLGAASDRYGYYRIENVPVGNYRLQVKYIGYKDFETDVRVSDVGQTVKLDIALEVSAVEIGEVVVEGLREGQVKALTQQMNAPNIKNVLAREEMERFPDLNTAEVLQRIPGIAVQRSLGEGRFVNIRGTEPRLSNVTIDGERIASPQDEERFIGLDVINASQLSSIEVVKALTPDMDADAIGGSVNLVTRSAFDYNRPVLKAKLGSGYSDLPNEPLYDAVVTYSTVLGAKKNFGVTVSGSWYRNNMATHSDEMDWGNEEDVNGNEIPFALTDLRFFNYDTNRDHFGFSSTLEYKINEFNRFYVRGTFNRRTDDQTRNMVRFRIKKGDYLNATTISKARVAFEMQDRNEIQKIATISGGGKNQFGSIDLDYDISYSYANETKKNPGQFKSEWQLDKKVNLSLDLSDTDFPQFSILNLDQDYLMDPSHWEIDNQDFRETFTSNKRFQFKLNLRAPYNFSNIFSELKLGTKIQVDQKDRNSSRFKYKWKGDQDVTMDLVASSTTVDHFLDNHYNTFPGPFVDPSKYESFFFQFQGKPDGLREQIQRDDTDGEGGRYDAEEDIFAFYLMNTVNIGKLMILAGVRDEITHTNYKGIELLFDDNGDFLNSQPIDQSRTYNNLFPYVHFRYRVTSTTNVRLAYTRSIARPNYFDLAPYRWVFPEDRELLLGNPDLDPTISDNFDILFEHYFQGVGIISGGLFYKSLDKIIFTRVFKQEGGPYDGFDVEQPVNGGSGTIVGAEFNWMQQFTFLPGFLSGFGIFANYTLVESDADLKFSDRNVIPGQAGDAANVGLNYEKYGLTARLSLNYTSEVMNKVGKNKDFDRFDDDHFQLDLSASYQIRPGINLYLEAINLLNEPKREFFGIESRTRLNEFYGRWIRSGIKLDW